MYTKALAAASLATVMTCGFIVSADAGTRPAPTPVASGIAGQITFPRTEAERAALLKRAAELRPADSPKKKMDAIRPANALAEVVNLGSDCIGLWEGPYPGGGSVWGEVEALCGSGNPGTEADSKLYRSGRRVDKAHDTDPNYSYVVTSVKCSGNKYYRQEEFMRAGVYSFGHYDALYINC